MARIVRELDFSFCRTWDDIHGQIRRVLELPDWYGENADALWDSLLGIMETPAEIQIRFQPEPEMEPVVRQHIELLISVFEEAAQTEPSQIAVTVER